MIFFLYVCSGYNILQLLQLKPRLPSVKLYSSGSNLSFQSNLSFHDHNLVTGSYARCTHISEKMSQRKYFPAKVQNHERQQ